MLYTLVQALLPVIFVIAVGWSAARFRWITADAIPIFTGFIVHFALPFALFLGVVKAKPADLTNVPFLLTFVIGLVGTYLLALLVGTRLLRLPLRDTAVFALGCAFSNTAYFGLPVLTAAVGPNGLLAIVVGNLVITVIVLPLTVVLIQTHGKRDTAAAASHRSTGAILLSAVGSSCAQPLVWLPVLGLVLALLGVRLPDPVLESCGEIGKIAGGLALFTLGLMIAAQQFRFNAQIAASLTLKNMAQAGIMTGAGCLLGLRGPLLAEALLVGVMPAATTSAMFAQRYHAFEDNAAAVVFLSTLLAIAGVALALVVLPLLPH